jgi:hypothetical protein
MQSEQCRGNPPAVIPANAGIQGLLLEAQEALTSAPRGKGDPARRSK